MTTERWTQESVDAVNARRGAKMPAHVGVRSGDPKAIGSGQTGKMITTSGWSAKPHKYRAIPCIVTADLTLFTRDDIVQAAAASGRTIEQLPLKTLAQQHGIIGEWFGSTKEAKRWIDLKRLEAAGAIRELRRQVTYDLLVNVTKIGKWIADFDYIEYDREQASWLMVREDSKGVRTPLYKRTKVHVEAQYGFRIRET